MQDMTQYGDIAKAENQSAMSEILRHFSSEYVLSIMNQEIGIFNTNPMDPSRKIQNIVSAIEEEYSYLKDNYPYDLENLTTVRNEMYTNIIQCIVDLKSESADKKIYGFSLLYEESGKKSVCETEARLIDGSTVEVSVPHEKILEVRYLWADSPAPVNLYSRELLPSSPFKFEVVQK